jgi:hypothetical protein
MKLNIIIEVETNLPEEIIDNIETTLHYECEKIFSELDRHTTEVKLDNEDCESTILKLLVVKK